MLNLTKMYLYRILHSTVALVCMLLLVGLTAFGLTVSCLMTRMVPDPETTAVMEEAEEEPEETPEGDSDVPSPEASVPAGEGKAEDSETVGNDPGAE